MAKNSIWFILLVGVCSLGAVPAEAGNRGRASSVCDDADLIGAAYAACHVYCEALDCDSEAPNGSERSCANALARFDDLTGGDLPPCLEPEGIACPCSAAWHGEGFFPANPDPGQSSCWGTVGGTEFGGLFLVVADPVEGTAGIATAGFMRDENPEAPLFLADCSSAREPLVEGAADTGVFQVVNTYAPGAEAVQLFQQGLYDACQADLMNIIERFGEEYGLVCEIEDVSVE